MPPTTCWTRSTTTEAAPGPHAVAPRLLAGAVSRWCTDPYSRGGWSLLRVGSTPDTRRTLGRPFGRVILAGEATHPTQAGMVHGAYEQGVAAARHWLAAGCRRVAVVGAGPAGAGAARTLADAGASTVVLEARDRIGGRVWTTVVGGSDRHDPGRRAVTMELGANWLQQGARNTLAPLAAAGGLATVDTDFNAPLVLRTGPASTPVATPAGSDALIAEFRARCAEAGADRSLADVVAEMCAAASPTADRPWTAADVIDVIDGAVTADTGAPLDTLSARYGFEPGVGDGDRWIVGGYGQLLDDLFTGIEIELGCPVTRIEWDESAVRLLGASDSASDGAAVWEADAAIVTVPSAVLASGAPRFDPPLPAAQATALHGLTVGQVEKAALVFSTRFWPVSATGLLHIHGPRAGDVSEWLDLTDTVGTPAITGIFVGPWATELWSGDDRAVAQAVGDVLAAAR